MTDAGQDALRVRETAKAEAEQLSRKAEAAAQKLLSETESKVKEIRLEAERKSAETLSAAKAQAAEAAEKTVHAQREAAAIRSEGERFAAELRAQVHRETEEARKAAKAAREEELAWGAAMVEDLKFELELMKMTNAEAQTAIQLRGMSAEAVARYGDEILALNEQIEANIKVTEQMDGLRQATSNLFDDLISGTVSANRVSTTLSGGGSSGNLNGTFYGPSAQEVAGAWRVTGGGNTAIGSFGAKR
jgi:hypothetical protein